LFKHALVQDTAYSTLLRGPRQALHRRIAEALETQSPELMDTQPELFAQHYAEAGLVEKSIAYWGKAGRRSAALSATAEAATQFQKGLNQLALLPDNPKRQRQKLELTYALGNALGSAKGLAAPETGRAYSRARELWEQLGAPPDFLMVVQALSIYHGTRGDIELAQRCDEDVLRISRQHNDSGGLILGHGSSGRNLFHAGNFVASRAHLEELLVLFDPITHHHHSIVAAHAHLGIAAFCLGFPAQGLAHSSTAITENQRVVHPPTLAASLLLGAVLLSLMEDNVALGRLADRLAALADEQGLPLYRGAGAVFRGRVAAENGDFKGGIGLLRSGVAAYRATGADLWGPFFVALLARACEIGGCIEEAMTLLDDTLQTVEHRGARWFAAELNRHKGRLLLQQGNAETAETLYRKALNIAWEQQAKMWELRAATSLARLWREQGRRSEARELLAPVYGWFTEGFETADLKDAKALLDELA
jgi:predicted ATPase